MTRRRPPRPHPVKQRPLPEHPSPTVVAAFVLQSLTKLPPTFESGGHE